jgi:hypothetical protein
MYCPVEHRLVQDAQLCAKILDAYVPLRHKVQDVEEDCE